MEETFHGRNLAVIIDWNILLRYWENFHSLHCVKRVQTLLEYFCIQCLSWIFWKIKNLGILSREPAGFSCSVDISCLIFIYCRDCSWWLLILLLLPPTLPPPFCLLAGQGPFDAPALLPSSTWSACISSICSVVIEVASRHQLCSVQFVLASYFSYWHCI